ncbi:hypothetical protein BLNAU_4356 [Blattamonas nauphoetae]|uniref:Uncharacterized protein n=1 Tax=Blattamonas nauphoetae TaxID=2049346 RepID=A0ABQ9YAA2_9EUKA|nr:hypothetical protein BLNAU_4356 [Blattamonas nauphoetae]
MKMMLISQGMNPQMIAMMQIAEMMGKKNQDDEENEEDENEKKNELKDGEKVETKSLKAKREAEEEEKENKKKKGRNDLTPQQIDLLNKMSNFVPNSFSVRVVIGIIQIVGVCRGGAEGQWIDSRHISSDICHMKALLASEGSSSENLIPTGDQIFDTLSIEPTMKNGSSVNALMFESTESMPYDPADCAVEIRIYGLTGNFSGLQALILKHIEAARMIATAPNPYNGMPLSNENVQIMGSLLVYDLRGGFKMLLEAVISEMTKTISEFQILLIISFIVAFFLACVAFFAFIVPSNPSRRQWRTGQKH